jgi:hypothetical protein
MSNTSRIGRITLSAALGAIALIGAPAQAFNVDNLMNPGNWMGSNTNLYEVPPPSYRQGSGAETGYYDRSGYGSPYPGYDSSYPDYGAVYPNYGSGYPDYGSSYPGFGSGYPDYGTGYWGYDNGYPGYGGAYPGYGTSYPNYDSYPQGYDSSTSVHPPPTTGLTGPAQMPAEELIYRLQQRIQELEQELRQCRSGQ